LEHAFRAASLEPGSGRHRLSLALAAVRRLADAEAQVQKALDLGLDDSGREAARTLLQSLSGLARKSDEPALPVGAVGTPSGISTASPVSGSATAPSGQATAWGVFVDADGTARVMVRGDRVEIRAAPGAYDLSAEIGNVNA